jgi:hypothetical protein
MSAIKVVGHEYTEHDARALLLGYAFGKDDLIWSRQERAFGDRPSSRPVRPGWGYRSYDCIPASPGPRLEGVDLLIGAGLNGRVDAPVVLSIQLVASFVSDTLETLEQRWPRLTFWDLDAGKFDGAEEGDPNWWMLRAWWLMMSAPDVGVAITHKTLHHKRPDLFPLLDNKTLEAFTPREAWAGIHHDLATQQSQFEELEEWFGEEATKEERQGVPITRLRIHDILLWCAQAAGQKDAAIRAGVPLLEGAR